MRERIPLQKRVQVWLQRHEVQLRPFLPPRAPVIVGVSGGPDSLALLHLLSHIFPSDRLVAAHLHHGWRPEADAEAEFVGNTAVSWGIPCQIERVDVSGLARAEGFTLEEAGRVARYRFLAALARREGASVIAVGHHASDQAETVLMHFLRGTGLSGLRGMLPVGFLPGAPDLRLIRPLLAVDPDDIRHYCQEHSLQPIIDRSNQDTTFFRNRLRHELLPLLETYNPQIRRRIRQLAAVAAADVDLLQTLTVEEWAALLRDSGPGYLALDREGWRALSLSLRRRLLRRAVAELRPSLRDVGFRTIEAARTIAERDASGGQATLPVGVTLTVEHRRLLFSADSDALPDALPQLPDLTPISLPVPGEVALAGDWLFTAREVEDVDLAQITTNPDPWRAFVTVDGDALTLRPRLPGERMQPLGMNGRSASLKEIMINRKIPARLRQRWPLVVTAAHPVWLVGHVLDERVRVMAESDRVIELRCYQWGEG